MEPIQETAIVTVKHGDVYVEDGQLYVKLDGITHRFALADVSKRLATATDRAQKNFVLSPSGYGIHWPEVDEDLSVSGLLARL